VIERYEYVKKSGTEKIQRSKIRKIENLEKNKSGKKKKRKK
jgi:hypothetical protein